MRQVMHEMARGGGAEFLQPMKHDATTDPEHRCGAGDRNNAQEMRHANHQPTTERLVTGYNVRSAPVGALAEALTTGMAAANTARRPTTPSVGAAAYGIMLPLPRRLGRLETGRSLTASETPTSSAFTISAAAP